MPLWAITRGDWGLSSCPKIPVFHKIKVRKTSIIHFFILCFISWCEKGDSNPKPLLHKPCNCMAWGARAPICMHFCMHSESICPLQSLENFRPSLKSFLSTKKRISRRTDCIFVIEVTVYDAQVFPLLAHLRSAAMAKIMPA